MDEERDQMPGERSARVQHRDGVVRLYQRCEYPMPIFRSPVKFGAADAQLQY